MALAPVSLAVGALAVAVTGFVATASTPTPVPSPTPAGEPRAGTATSSPAVAPAGTVPARSAPVGRFRWPLRPAPTVLRRFAVGPYRWSPGHRGVDLAANAGQVVLAAGPGVVVFAGRVSGIGVVVVDHAGSLRTTYEPVDAAVRVGTHTVAGARIGTLGAWPGHCPISCLHWGAIRAGAYLDPLTLLGLVPAVLLPLAARPPS